MAFYGRWPGWFQPLLYIVPRRPLLMRDSIKGASIVPTLKFLKEKFGKEGLDKVMGPLSEASRTELQHLSTSQWYSLECFVELLKAIQTQLGKGLDDMDILRETGRYASTEGLMWMNWLYLKVQDPFSLAEKYSLLWSSFYNSGTFDLLEMDREGKKVRFRLSGFKVKDRQFYERLSGWIEGAIATAGGKSPKVTYDLKLEGGKAVCELLCVFE